MSRGHINGYLSMRLSFVLVLFSSCATAMAAGGEPAESPTLFGGSIATAAWSMIIFILLLVLLNKVAWKPILAALKSREDMIRNEIDNAKRRSQEAEELLETHRQQLAEANAEADKLLKATTVEAERIKSDLLEQAQTLARESLHRANSQIELAKETALREIYAGSAEVASDLAAKILGREVNTEDHRVLIDGALDDLEAKV